MGDDQTMGHGPSPFFNVKEERVRAFLRRVYQSRGYVYASDKFLAEGDYEWALARQAFYEKVREERFLPLKYKELLFITVACAHGHETGMRTHIKKALDLGASKNEILETIEVASLTCGGGVLVTGLRILMEVLGDKTVPRDPAWEIR